MQSLGRVAAYVNLSQAGVHPFIRNIGPSRPSPSLMTCITWRQFRSASSRTKYIARRKLTHDPFAALWILLLSTSAGAHAVVATVPANREASAWVRMSSSRLVRDKMARFAAAYLAGLCQLEGQTSRGYTHGAIWDTSFTRSAHRSTQTGDGQGALLMITLRTTFADRPLPKTLTPSSLPMRYNPVMASE
jgi:hypothetical protein